MPIPMTPRNLPSLKRYLYHAYMDLKSIEQNVFGHDSDHTLSNLERAVIMLEDRRYFSHAGIDARSIIREVFRALTFRKHGGASTVEMQFVRTCTGYKELSLRRKFYEAFLAFALTHRRNKLEVLRSYLSIAYFGTGLHGAESAAQCMFGKTVSELSAHESTILAAMLVYPRPRKENDVWKERVERRANYGDRLLIKYGHRYLT